MADSRCYPLDIQQILAEAQHRWLRPAEICEILRNFKKFPIAPEPPHLPMSGSLFLFDRKVLRYFRKDGHNWRKKKDGKTVKEAHERLKSANIDVLHCYYAHGEENENFQRRSYWLLEEELSNIVLVHYLEVKGNRTNFNRIKNSEDATPYPQQIEDNMPPSEMDTSVSSNFRPDGYQVPAHTTDTVSMNSVQASEYEDAESVYQNQASSGFHSFLEVQQPVRENVDVTGNYQGKLSAVSRRESVSLPQLGDTGDTHGAGLLYQSQKPFDLPSWEDLLGNCAHEIESSTFQPPNPSQTDTAEIIQKQEDEILRQLFTSNFGKLQELESRLPIQKEWQTFQGASSHQSKWAMDQKLHPDSTCDFTSFHEHGPVSGDLGGTLELFQTRGSDHPVPHDVHIQLLNNDHDMTLDRKSNSSAVKQHLLDGSSSEGGLKKLDSFNRWMSKELGDVNESHVQSSSGAYWNTVENESGIYDPKIPSPVHLDTYLLGPSLSQDQLFSIIDFSPNWVYVGSQIKVLITGRFLKSMDEAENCKWSCMFGEIEVRAEIIADGVLRCQTPLNKGGVVPFYVTCSDRVACSEVREFEYRPSLIKDVNITDKYSSNGITDLHMRFGKLLSLGSATLPDYGSNHIDETFELSNKIGSFLKEDDEWDRILNLTSQVGVSLEKVKEELLQKLLKERLHVWLLHKAAEGGKGPSILDEGGQGVLHFAATLGYDWALEPTILAGVSVNFRDVNGWTALHWAASCGRERTVASLILIGAAPGALTDPSPAYPTGRTPADLASANGHKGIAGYLAESALSAHLSSLDLEKSGSNVTESYGAKVVQITPELSTNMGDRDLPYGVSLKDSLAAVCNATQAAARIHQVFRVQSFQKKQLREFGDNKHGISHERALSFITVKANKPGQHDEPVHAAAIRIQNKFRGWKGRKEFLIIRQRIVKIQAHVRGHQVRKNYRKIVWSVGIVEKVILRWRRKRSGLRGFKSEALVEGPSKQEMLSKEDEYDFFKEGRKQTEARSRIALARVKSMHQYPEARDQYSRMLNVVTEIQETKVYNRNHNSKAAGEFDDLIDLEALLDDDTFMPTAT